MPSRRPARKSGPGHANLHSAATAASQEAKHPQQMLPRRRSTSLLSYLRSSRSSLECTRSSKSKKEWRHSTTSLRSSAPRKTYRSNLRTTAPSTTSRPRCSRTRTCWSSSRRSRPSSTWPFFSKGISKRKSQSSSSYCSQTSTRRQRPRCWLLCRPSLTSCSPQGASRPHFSSTFWSTRLLPCTRTLASGRWYSSASQSCCTVQMTRASAPRSSRASSRP